MEKKDHIYQCRGFNESVQEREIWCDNVGALQSITWLRDLLSKQCKRAGAGLSNVEQKAEISGWELDQAITFETQTNSTTSSI